jgi:hypothetical protein
MGKLGGGSREHQSIDFVGEGGNLGEFKGSRLFMPSTLELGKMTYEWGEVWFMIFAIKPGHVPSPERGFHQKINEPIVGASLKVDTANNFSIGGAGLVFQKELIFE